jgi:hypothetical protein
MTDSKYFTVEFLNSAEEEKFISINKLAASITAQKRLESAIKLDALIAEREKLNSMENLTEEEKLNSMENLTEEEKLNSMENLTEEEKLNSMENLTEEEKLNSVDKVTTEEEKLNSVDKVTIAEEENKFANKFTEFSFVIKSGPKDLFDITSVFDSERSLNDREFKVGIKNSIPGINVNFWKMNSIIRECNEKYDVYTTIVSNTIKTSRILYETTEAHVKNQNMENGCLHIADCTETKENNMFDKNTINIKKVYEIHERNRTGGWREDNCLLKWTQGINMYMKEKYNIENYIDCLLDDNDSNDSIVFNIVEPNTYIASVLSNEGTIIYHNITEIINHNLLSLYFAVIKLIIDTLEKNKSKELN